MSAPGLAFGAFAGRLRVTKGTPHMARPKKSNSDTVVVENTRPCAIFLPGDKAGNFRRVLLGPGENNVPAAHLAAIAGNKAVSQYLKLGYLVDKGAGAAKPLVFSLDDMSEADAVERLGAIEDPAIVQDLRDRTKKAPLKELAQIRLRELLGEDDSEA